MECLSAAAALIAIVLLVAILRQRADRVLTVQQQTRQIEGLRLLVALLFPALGVLRRGKVLRYASLAVMLLAVGKVFLYDTADLSDLYRVFSFLGLGVSLLLLAWLYQRFVFREAER